MAKIKNPEKAEKGEILSKSESNTQADVPYFVEDYDGEVGLANKEKQPQPNVEIPAKVLAYLKHHPELENVYVDKAGGTYSGGTNKIFMKDAILYNNPYFKH